MLNIYSCCSAKKQKSSWTVHRVVQPFKGIHSQRVNNLPVLKLDLHFDAWPSLTIKQNDSTDNCEINMSLHHPNTTRSSVRFAQDSWAATAKWGRSLLPQPGRRWSTFRHSKEPFTLSNFKQTDLRFPLSSVWASGQSGTADQRLPTRLPDLPNKTAYRTEPPTPWDLPPKNLTLWSPGGGKG